MKKLLLIVALSLSFMFASAQTNLIFTSSSLQTPAGIYPISGVAVELKSDAGWFSVLFNGKYIYQNLTIATATLNGTTYGSFSALTTALLADINAGAPSGGGGGGTFSGQLYQAGSAVGPGNPLPVSVTGVSTSANQSTGITNQTNGLQKTQIVDPSGNAITSTTFGAKQRADVNLASGSAPNTTAPTWMDQVGGVDGSGNAQPLQMDASKNLKVAIQGTPAVSLAGGNAVAYKVDGSGVTQPVSLAGGNAVAYKVDGSAVTQPVSLAGGNAVAYKVDGSAVTQPVSFPSVPNVNVANAITNQVAQIVAQPSSQSLAATGSIQWTIQGGGFYFLTITNAPAATAAFAGTVVFETSPDNSAWTAANGNPLFGLPGSGLAPVNSTTAAGIWQVQAPTSALYIRARVSAYTSGTVWAFLETANTVNSTTILPFTPSVTSGASLTGWINTTGLSEISIRVSAVTTTVVTAQGTNDPTGTDIQSIAILNDNSANQAVATTFSAAGTYSIIPTHKWVRFQVTTTGTVLTIQGVTAREGQSVKLNGAGSSIGLNAATIAQVTVVPTVTSVTAVASVTSDKLAAPVSVADVASAALTTTTTTANFTPGNGNSYVVEIPVTVVSGTTPTLDVEVQESEDNTNWYAVYDFPRITTTGVWRSPKLSLNGVYVRYVQTVAGTTPSFTRAINRLQESDSQTPIRQIIDRTIVLTTLASSTPSLNAQNCRNAQVSINIGTATTPPQLQLQGSDDNGSTWYSIGSPLTAVASSTVQLTVNNVNAQLVRATVSTIGNTVVAGYTLVKAF